jgi:hypothetical protein
VIGGKGDAALLHAPEDGIGLFIAYLKCLVMRIALLRVVELEIDTPTCTTAKTPRRTAGAFVALFKRVRRHER